jgi:hypothetical protein
MDSTEGFETSANINQTLGIHPKVETVNTEHSEILKSRKILLGPLLREFWIMGFIVQLDNTYWF